MGVGTSTDRRFRGYRFPAIIIGEVVWLRFRFNLSLRDIPALMATRGVEVSHETVREWCDKFGAAYAKEIQRRRPRPGDKWHLDEIVVKMNGVAHYLWRAVDQHGITLGVLVTRRRDASAASRFLRKLLSSEQYVPRVLVTDKAPLLRRRQAARPSRRRAPAEQVPEQPGRELPPADQAAGTRDAAVRLSRAGRAVLLRPRPDLRSFPAATTPDGRRRAPGHADRPPPILERHDRRPPRSTRRGLPEQASDLSTGSPPVHHTEHSEQVDDAVHPVRERDQGDGASP